MSSAAQNHPGFWGLALSTSSGVASLAVVGQQLLEQVEIAEYSQQSAQLLPSLQQLMQQHGLAPQACMGLAVDIGPGGFTSLRTACGLAQGLATAWQVPVWPVPSLYAMLLQCPASAWQGLAEGTVVWVLTDARLQEVYVAAWAKTEQGWQCVEEPTLWPIGALKTWQAPYVVCDAAVAALLNPSLCPQVQVQRASSTGVAKAVWPGLSTALFAGVAPLAGVPLANCQPLYVRERVAQTLAERQHKAVVKPHQG